MESNKPKGLAKIWREIKRPFGEYTRKNTKTKVQNCNEPLSASEWGDLYNESQIESLVKSIENRQWSCWTEEMLSLTQPSEKILEIGGGSGQTSLALASAGRLCTALDFEQRCLDLTQSAAKRLGIEVQTVQTDAEKDLPFKDNEFDCVFQAGLLEHFDKEQRIAMLQNWSRVAKRMVSLIPNAASLAYRVGKAIQERDGTWAWGKEMPQYSLVDEFHAAGLTVSKEYTIDEQSGLNFLPREHYLRIALEKWMNENPCKDNCGQGYLLVTVGNKE